MLAAIQALEPGEVVTYGEVAARAGRPGAARAVGNILSRAEGLPWWRVVRAGGHLAKGDRQADLLRREGVAAGGGRITDPELRRRLVAGLQPEEGAPAGLLARDSEGTVARRSTRSASSDRPVAIWRKGRDSNPGGRYPHLPA